MCVYDNLTYWTLHLFPNSCVGNECYEVECCMHSYCHITYIRNLLHCVLPRIGHLTTFLGKRGWKHWLYFCTCVHDLVSPIHYTLLLQSPWRLLLHSQHTLFINKWKHWLYFCICVHDLVSPIHYTLLLQSPWRLLLHSQHTLFINKYVFHCTFNNVAHIIHAHWLMCT